MIRLLPTRTGRRLATAVLLIAVVAGCGSGTTTGSPEPTFAPAGTAVGDAGGDVGVDVEVGGCIQLSGTDEVAAAEPADCGSSEANYKVVGKAPTSEACIADSDGAYYETLAFGTGEAGALCLDLDWVQGDCFDLEAENPARVDCATAAQGAVRVGETIRGTVDESACPEGGIAYGTRMFVVCLEDPTAA